MTPRSPIQIQAYISTFSGRDSDTCIFPGLRANIFTQLQSPEIQTMYSLNMPVSAIRTKIRQEFEKHRYVSQLSVVDVLLYQSHAEFQVSWTHWR